MDLTEEMRLIIKARERARGENGRNKARHRPNRVIK